MKKLIILNIIIVLSNFNVIKPAVKKEYKKEHKSHKYSFENVRNQFQTAFPKRSFNWFTSINAQNPKNGNTALIIALKSLKTELVVPLLRAGANPNIENRKGLNAYNFLPTNEEDRKYLKYYLDNRGN